MGNFVGTKQSEELMLEYKGFKIDGDAIPMYMSGCESLGVTAADAPAQSSKSNGSREDV